MKAYWIETREKRITEVEYDGLTDLQYMVGGTIGLAMKEKNGDVLYVNDEGLFKYRDFFIVKGAQQPFAGNGVYVGRERGQSGKTFAPRNTLAELIARVRFPTPAQVLAETSGMLN